MTVLRFLWRRLVVLLLGGNRALCGACPGCGDYVLPPNGVLDRKRHVYWCFECHVEFTRGVRAR